MARPHPFFTLAFALAAIPLLLSASYSLWADTLSTRLTASLGYLDLGFEESIATYVPGSNTLICRVLPTGSINGVDNNLNEALMCTMSGPGLKPGDVLASEMYIVNSGSVPAQLDRLSLTLTISWPNGGYQHITLPMTFMVVSSEEPLLLVDIAPINITKFAYQSFRYNVCEVRVNQRALSVILYGVKPGATVSVYDNGTRIVCVVDTSYVVEYRVVEKSWLAVAILTQTYEGTLLDLGEGSYIDAIVNLEFVNG